MPSKSFASVLASSIRLGLACCGETMLVFVSDARSTPDVSPLGRRRRQLARQSMRCRLLLGHGCAASSSVGGEGDGIDPDAALPPRGEDVVDSAAVGRADGRRCRCRAAEEGVPCRSCSVPGWRCCWRLPIWSLTRSCSSTRSRPLPGAPTVGVSTPGGPWTDE
jgi:hypothetical protein